MGGHNLPPLVEIGLINVSENLGKAAVLPALPLITPLSQFNDLGSKSQCVTRNTFQVNKKVNIESQ